MTDYAAVAAGAVVAPAVLGYGLVRALGVRPEHGRAVAWGFGYLVGQYVLAHVTFLWLVAGRPVPGPVLPIGAFVAGVGTTLLVRRRAAGAGAPPARAAWPLPPWWAWLPLALVTVGFAERCLAVNVDPVRYGDESQIWAAKAKVLFTAPGFDVQEGLSFFVEHADYPLWNPLLQVLAFATADRVLHFENRLPIQACGAALLMLLAAGLLRRTPVVVAGLGLVAFAGSSFASVAPLAYADVVLAAATFATVDALLRARETGDAVWWRLACITGAGMLASKNEGLLLGLAVAAPFVVVRALDARHGGRPIRWRAAGWLPVPLAALVAQRVFCAAYGLKNDLTDPTVGGGHGLFERIVAQWPSHASRVLDFYGAMSVDAAQHRLLPLGCAAAALLALALRPRRWLAGAGAPACAVVAAATLGYMLVFVGTHAELSWHLQTAASRTLLHVVPVALLALCVSAWPASAPALLPAEPAAASSLPPPLPSAARSTPPA